MWCRRIPTERAVVKTQVEVEESLKCRLKEGKTFCLKLLLCSNICTRTKIEGNKTIINYCILDSVSDYGIITGRRLVLPL